MKETFKVKNEVMFFKNGNWINLNEIPKLKNKYRWSESIGKKVSFSCGGVNGEFKIVEFDSSKRIFKVEYLNQETYLPYPSLMKCALSGVTKRLYEYRCNIGDEVNNLKILKRIRMKNGNVRGYRVRCLKDGYEFEISQTNIDCGSGCHVCGHYAVAKWINDIATTHPYLVKYFLNKEDSCKYSAGSNKILHFVCPDCGFVKKSRIADIVRIGFSCKKCGDGISFPNKFMFDVLEQLNIDFIPELSCTTFDWCERYQYDFYLPDYKIIVEMDGGLGHGNKIHTRSNITKLETYETDRYKEKIAIEHGIYIIRIDCDYTYLDRGKYIYESILNSKLKYIFDFSSVDYFKCYQSALNSKVKQVCEMYNLTLDIDLLSEKFKIDKSTVRNYLKLGNKFSWSNYDPILSQKNREKTKGSKNAKWIDYLYKINKDTKIVEKIYESTMEARKEGYVCVPDVLSGRQKQTKGYIFMYQKDWFALQKQLYNLA